MKKSTNVARRAKSKIGSAMVQLAVMASSLSVSAAATAYYGSRRGNYNTRKNHSYLVDNGLGGISRDLLKYKKSHTIKTGTTTGPIGELFLNKTASIRELVFVDRNIKDYYLFSKLSKPGVEVIELPKEANGLDFLIKTLGQYQDLSAVHILSHANAGELLLGNTKVDKKALQNNVEAFNKLNKAIVKGGDLLFYGCELGKGKEGEEFLDIIKGNTHVDVAASNNLTGNADYNGDWELEIRKGDIITTPLHESVAMKDFTGVLQYTLQDFGYISGGPTANTGCPTDRSGYTYGYYSLISGNYTVCGFMGIGPGDSGNGFGGTTVNMSHYFEGVYTPAFLGESGTASSNSGTHAIEVKSSTLFQLTNVVADEWPPNPAGSNGYTFSNVRIIGYIDGGGTIASSAHSTVDDHATTSTFTFDSDELADFAGVSLTKFRLEFQNDTGLATGMRLVSYTTAEPVDADGNLTAAAGVTEPVGLDTSVDTVGEAMDVFDFTISDGGTSDGLATTISQIVVNVSGTSTDAERGQVTWRLNGPDVSNVTGTYNAGSDTVTFSGLSISIADGGNETYTVNAYYNDNLGLTEDHTFILSVDGDTDLTVGAGGTQMGAASAVTNGTGSTIDVVATQLSFTTQPAGSVSGSALTTQPVVAARDAFGNTDADFTETITLTEASAGSLNNNTQAATNGVATFTSLIYTATADQQSFTLTANDQDGVGTDLPTSNANAVTSDVVATKLVYSTQPSPTTVNSGAATSFTTVPVVSAMDANNIVDTGYSTDITLSEVNGAGSATMTATGDTDGNGASVSITPSSGVSTFTSMQITYTASGGASETFNLRASSGGLTTADSSQLTGVVNAPPVITNLDSDSVSWAGIGNTVTLDSGGDVTASDTELDALNGANGDYSGGSLTVQRSGGAVTGDVFGFDTSGALFTISGSNLQSGGQTFATFTNTNGVLTISFTSSGTTATTALVSDVMQRITYRNDTPAGDATVRFTLSDGTASDTADVTVTTDNIYITNTTDTATIDPTNGISFSEAIAIAAADGTGTQTLILDSSLAAQTVSTTSVTSLTESLTLDMDSASGVTLSGGNLTLGGGVTLTLNNGASDTATLSTTLAGTGNLNKAGVGTLTLGSTGNSGGADGNITVGGGTLVVASDANLLNGTLTLAAGTLLQITSSTNVDNAITLTGNATVQVDSNATLGGTLSGNFTLTKTGTGTLTLSSNNAGLTGGMLISAGTLSVSGDNQLSTGTITLNGGTLNLNGSSFTVDNAIALGAGGGTISVTSAGKTLSGVISGTGALAKTGGQSLTLAGTNTWSGGVTISGANGLSVTDGTNLGSGTVTLNGSSLLTVTGSGVTISNSLAMAGDASFSNANNVTWSGVISGASALTKTGAGTLTLSGTQTHNGGTTVSAGTISIAGDSNIGFGTLTLNGGTLIVTGSGINIDNAISLGVSNGTVSNANAITLSGVISGSGNLTKSGAGILTLSATNTFTGSTALSAGQLTVSGSLTGAVTAATGTTLESASSIGGLVTINSGATLQTGSSPGALTLGNGLTVNSGGTLVARINGTTASSQYDQYNVTGAVTLGGTLSLTGTYTPVGGNTFVIINNDAADAVTGTFNGLAEGDSSTAFGGEQLTVSYLGSTGNDVTLTMIAPVVNSVSVPSNGTYVAGQNLDFTVNTDENITVNTGGGTPQIALTVGATTRYASYLSGSGTSALVFRYTVQNGDSDTDGIAVAGVIDTNGGTLQDSSSGNDLNTTLNSVGATTSILVDAVMPTVSSVSVPANSTYVTGQNLDFTINFSENITVNTGGGTPQMSITIGSTTRQATYISGSGTSAIVFRYTVQSGELDTDGITVGSLAANGGTLRDGAGNDATLTLNSVGSTTAVLVGYATVTWTGATNNNWATASNWDINEVPSSAADVIIPSGLTNYPTASLSVTFNSLTINSGASFIPESTVTGNITYNRNLPTTDWYLISMPIAGEVMEDVITAHPLASGTGSNLGLSYYQNSGGSPWEYVTAATTGPFINGYGYAINLTTSGDLSVTGTANTSDVSSGITTGSRTNFNLLGNPFTAYVNSATFTATNTALLSEETVWLWNGTQYVTYNVVSPIEIAPVQGFFVEASGNGNVVFSTSNLSHQGSDTFMKQTSDNEQETLSSFELFVTGKSEQSSTKVFFVDGKTTGFDNGYDSKLFGEVDYTFVVYTGMVLGNDSKKLAIQTLPGIGAEAMKIPVGLIAEAGKTITFSVQAKNLPTGVGLILEDKLNNTYVNLLEGDHSITLKNTVAGLGKFYIHTTAKLNTEDIENELSSIEIYKSAAKELSIEGLRGLSQVELYSLTGEKIMQKEMRSTGINKIDLQRFPIGVYIVRVSSESGSVTKKIILE